MVIVDPPRKGLDAALCSELARSAPPRLVYVACDLERFVADARELLGSGVFRLERLVPFALFPFTGHVEVVASFSRVATDRQLV